MEEEEREQGTRRKERTGRGHGEGWWVERPESVLVSRPLRWLSSREALRESFISESPAYKMGVVGRVT